MFQEEDLTPPFDGSSFKQFVDIVKPQANDKGTGNVILLFSQATWIKMLAFLHVDQIRLDGLL